MCKFETGLENARHEYTQSARRGTIAASSEIHCCNTKCDDESRRSVSCSGVSWLSLVGARGWETVVCCHEFWRKFHAFALCAAGLFFTKNLVEGFGFPLVKGPIAYSDSSAGRGIANRMRHCESQASSRQKSLVTNMPEWMDR